MTDHDLNRAAMNSINGIRNQTPPPITTKTGFVQCELSELEGAAQAIETEINSLSGRLESVLSLKDAVPATAGLGPEPALPPLAERMRQIRHKLRSQAAKLAELREAVEL